MGKGKGGGDIGYADLLMYLVWVREEHLTLATSDDDDGYDMALPSSSRIDYAGKEKEEEEVYIYISPCFFHERKKRGGGRTI